MNFNSKSTLPRYLFIIIPMTLVGLAVIGKAAFEMTARADYWETVRKRLEMQQRVIPAVRGNIYSADGELMVGTLPVYNLRMDFVIKDPNAKAVEKRRKSREALWTAKADSFCMGLHELFPAKSADEYKKLINSHWGGNVRNLLIARNVSYIQYKECMKLPYAKAGAIATGFYAEPVRKRQKPYGSMASRMLGTYDALCDSAINGLEFAFDSLLRGVNGRHHLEKVRSAWTDKIDQEPIDGYDIITTLDVGMQDAAEKILNAKLVELDAEIGVVVLMEVKTGDVKALVNLVRTAPGQYREGANYALTALWEPGSTFKTASMMVALEDGVITRNDYIDTGNGQWPMYGRTMKDHNWHRGGYGRISADECLMFSSNVGVSRIIDNAYHDHPEKYVDGLYREGVGVAFDMQISGAAKPNVRRPKKNDPHWYRTTLPWMSIGYETQIPPIYTATFYNAIANNGRMVKPRFVKEIQRNGITHEVFPVEVVKERICKTSTLRDIHAMLERVVNDPKGLGRKAGSKLFKVCGKTGTAQIADLEGGYHSGHSRYMVSFAGYYPSENPRYTCLVCIKKAGLPASGGGHAGPVFSELAHYVMAKGVYRETDAACDSTSMPKPSDHVDEILDIAADVPLSSTPDVIGLGARDAVRLLEERGYKVRLLGQGRVVRQDIHPGARVEAGKTITLEMRTPKMP